MAKEPSQTIGELLREARGAAIDDLLSAKMQFEGCSDEQMQPEHQRTGKTRAQVLSGYQEKLDEVKAAIRWLERTSEPSA